MAGKMRTTASSIVRTYSDLADAYDADGNIGSCWGRASVCAVAGLELKRRYRFVVDVGCGTGRALLDLASRSGTDVRFVGLDPADNMCRLARARLQTFSNVAILGGSFEHIPLQTGSVDYLYSILAFHWTTDPQQSVDEIARVLTPSGEADLVFIGRENGREFVKKTSPIFLKHMGPALFLQSARLRKQFTKDEATDLFGRRFGSSDVTVEESFDTYYDSLDGHWSWWVRIEGQFLNMPPATKARCDAEVKEAIAGLATDRGIPYTVHLLHVKLRRS